MSSEPAISHQCFDEYWPEFVSMIPFALEEIRRHKWIESEKARCDLGPEAVTDWVRKFWWRFCRQRRIEHVEGRCCWAEFKKIEFGIIDCLISDRILMDEIIARMKNDLEHIHDNLEIINWAEDRKDSEFCRRVVTHLHVIDINAARLPVPSELIVAA